MTDPTQGIDETLNSRELNYGAFIDHAEIAQALKDEMWRAPKWAALDPDMKEALEMVQHKIARILNGNPTVTDSWHDIAGYVRLVERRLQGEMPTIADDLDLDDLVNVKPGAAIKIVHGNEAVDIARKQAEQLAMTEHEFQDVMRQQREERGRTPTHAKRAKDEQQRQQQAMREDMLDRRSS